MAKFLHLHHASIVQMLAENKSQQKIADALGANRTSIERYMKRVGLKAVGHISNTGANNPQWKGGRYLRGDYWYVRSPGHPNAVQDGGVAEHRLVMEQKLGRYLERSEVVHHRDGDPQNNHPDNLEAFPTNGEHLRHELSGRCPNWTPDGRARIEEGVQLAAAIHRHTKTDDDLRLLRKHRRLSEDDSNGEHPVS